VLTHPTFVHLRSIKEGHRPNETLHYKAKQNEMNGTLSTKIALFFEKLIKDRTIQENC